MDELKQTIATITPQAPYYAKPHKPDILQTLPEDVENKILEYTDYHKNYIYWVFDVLNTRTQYFLNLYMNMKPSFMRYRGVNTCEWNGEARDLVKAQIKKQIDELTALYNQI